MCGDLFEPPERMPHCMILLIIQLSTCLKQGLFLITLYQITLSIFQIQNIDNLWGGGMHVAKLF